MPGATGAELAPRDGFARTTAGAFFAAGLLVATFTFSPALAAGFFLAPD
jgi:hypothetical protein